MGQHHRNPEVNQAFVRLLDLLVEDERNTGRRNTFVFVPHIPDEPVVIAQDGKPVPESPGMGAQEILAIAVRERNAGKR